MKDIGIRYNTGEFTKKVREMSSQLFVYRGIIEYIPSNNYYVRGIYKDR